MRRSRASSRGLTRIEIFVVIAIIALVTGVAVAGSGQLPSARLRGAATMLASAIKVGYTRATSTSRDLRLVMDMDTQQIWLEQSDLPMLVSSKGKDAALGADPMTAKEKEAIQEGEKILKGPPVPKPRFTPVASWGFGDSQDTGKGGGKGGKPLQRGITFRAVQTTHDDKARTSGRAYLYFWPGGRTELAAITIRIGESTDDDLAMTLLVAPLTGKVKIKGGAVELKIPTDDTTASDRQDTPF
jgi:general secretion pathway protein H